MLRIPYDKIIKKIKEKSSISEEEIKSKIDAKLSQLSGLISKEGAAHIIANELGVKLFENLNGKVKIDDILTGMRSVETLGKITQVFNINEFQRKDGATGKVFSFVIGDKTGTIRIVCWGSQTEISEKIKQGDIIKVVDCYVRENQNRKEIHLNDRSKVIINPPGETIEEIKQTVDQSTRKQIKDLKESDINVELFATITHAFEPRFFEVCPTCARRARQKEENFVCELHGTVIPEQSYVMNVILDDGTGTIRSVFFGKAVELLTEKQKQEIKKIKDNPMLFEEIKNCLLGIQIRINGRITKNQMFQRLEIIANSIDKNPDIDEEIRRVS